MSTTISDASPAGTQPSGPLAPPEMVDVRRFCGYPAAGSTYSGFAAWRFFEVYGVLEFRMINLTAPELQQVRQYIAQLYPLEQAILSASTGLDTDQAAVFRRNPREMAERNALFRQWRARLCAFLGIPPGPEISANDGAITI